MTEKIKVYLDGTGSYYSSISGPRSSGDSFIPHPSPTMVTLLGENSKPIQADSFHEAHKILADAGIVVGLEDQVTQLPSSLLADTGPEPVSPVPTLTKEEADARINETLASINSNISD